MTSDRRSPAAELAGLLQAAGLDVSPADRARLLRGYTALKPSVESLYALPEARHESPALLFSAEPHLADWWE
jgi:hypothetical protein